MTTHCPANERIKRDYLDYQKHAQRDSEPSIDGVAKAISRFENYTSNKDFKKFHIQQAIGFKKKIDSAASTETGKPLSLATQRSTVNALRAFFVWLAAQPGYKSRITYSDADYFNLSEKYNRAAQNHTARPFPSLDQVQFVIRSMPTKTAIEQRNRAIISFVLLTGCSVRALVSLKLKHIDLASSSVSLDAREVETKIAKSFVTFFMPVGDDIAAIFRAWIETLTKDHLWAPSDPLFPATNMAQIDGGGFRATGLKREHWTTANAVRRIFKESFEAVELPYFHPHSVRHTLVQLGQQICASPEEFKAWSQNLGHEHVMTTFKSYGNVSPPRQAELIRQLGTFKAPAQRELADLLRLTANAVENQRTFKT